jgi:hypothetical protein
MSVLAVEYDLADLLQKAGARVRGNRADCPRCSAARTVSYTAEVFYCHHAGCDFRGNAFTLARELGIARRLPPAEARTLRLERGRAEAAASTFLMRVRGARFGLGALHIELLNLRDESHKRLKANPDDQATWEMLAYVYNELPRVRAELILLGEGMIEDRVAWFEAGEETRREMAGRILRLGGLPTFDGKWAELD